MLQLNVAFIKNSLKTVYILLFFKRMFYICIISICIVFYIFKKYTLFLSAITQVLLLHDPGILLNELLHKLTNK